MEYTKILHNVTFSEALNYALDTDEAEFRISRENPNGTKAEIVECLNGMFYINGKEQMRKRETKWGSRLDDRILIPWQWLTYKDWNLELKTEII